MSYKCLTCGNSTVFFARRTEYHTVFLDGDLNDYRSGAEDTFDDDQTEDISCPVCAENGDAIDMIEED